MELLKNLTGYKDPRTSDVVIKGISYKCVRDAKPDVIIAQAFGTGSYNRDLAMAVDAARDEYGDIPAILQAGVFDLYRSLYHGRDIYTLGASEKSVRAFQDITTEQVLAISKLIMQEEAIEGNKALLIAHPAHMERVLAIAVKLGLEGIPFCRRFGDWDKNDGQKHVRSASAWAFREFLARIYLNHKDVT